jgi:transposase
MTKSISSPEYKLFCELMIEARKQQGLTQAELASRLGIPQTQVSKYELGERRLDVREFLRTTHFLQVDPHSMVRAINAVASWREPGESEQENALWADMDAATLLENLRHSREQAKEKGKEPQDETDVPDAEAAPTPKRRLFTVEEKLRILEEADACTELGELTALLRREGIYRSYVYRWRRKRDRGLLQIPSPSASGQGALSPLASGQGAPSPKRREPKPPVGSELTGEKADLQRENEQLRARLARAEAIIEALKEYPEGLGLPLEENESDEQ